MRSVFHHTHLAVSLFFASALFAQSPTPLPVFGPVGFGGDDTAVFQNALNSTAGGSQILEVPAGTYNVRPLSIPSNTRLILDAGAVVQAVSGYGQYDRLLSIVDAQNISITGTPGQSVFRMRKDEYTSGEYRHCLGIYGARGLQISGIQCNDSGGDGMYIGEGAQGYSADIQVSDSGFNENRRQGLTLTSGVNIWIRNCRFTNTNGTGPSDGIDIEPNQPSDLLQNIEIDNSSAVGNSGNGLVFAIEALNQNSTPVYINVVNFTSMGNRGSGFFGYNEPNAPFYPVSGSITVSNSSSVGDAQYGALASFWDAGGALLKFQNLTVTNANGAHNNIDNAAIAVKRGGGAVHPMGNVHFFGTSIIDTIGKLDVYFTVYDWSNIGISQLQFLNPGQLSGASQGTGLYQGLPTLSFDVN